MTLHWIQTLWYYNVSKTFWSLETGKGGGDAEAGGSGVPITDFTTEYAKSGGAKCRGCEEKIGKVSCFIF